MQKYVLHYGVFLTCLLFVGLVLFYPSDLRPNQIFVNWFGLLAAFASGSCFFLIHSNKILRNCISIVFGMLAFSAIMVPIYDVFCDITGLNGKVDLSLVTASSDGIDMTRLITVEFDVNYNKGMPWEFKPQHHIVKLHPGEMISTSYYAKNPTAKLMTAQAIPSITPGLAGKHLKKVECFCFSAQTLAPGESQDMHLRFYLDKELPKDIQRLTLSYTLFDISDQA